MKNVPGLLAIGLFLVFAWPALKILGGIYDTEDDYSHGYLVPLISLFAAYQIWSQAKTQTAAHAAHGSHAATSPKSTKPRTCPAAIVLSVTKCGALSRPAMVRELKDLGFDNAKQFGTQLRKVVKNGLIVNNNGSYSLGEEGLEKLSSDERRQYDESLRQAQANRALKKAQEQASKARAEAQYERNVEAGGLTACAQHDQSFVREMGYGDRALHGASKGFKATARSKKRGADRVYSESLKMART